MATPNLNWQQIEKILGSKGAEVGLNMLGSALLAKQQADQFDRQMASRQQDTAQNAAQFRANLLQRQQEADRADQLARAGNAMNSTRLGENENFALRNRIASALLPRMADAPGFTPADPAIAALMPQGGLDLKGIFTPEVLASINDKATASAIAQRGKMQANIDPETALPDLQAMGLDTEGTQQELMNQWQQDVLTQRTEAADRQRELIMRALDEDLAGRGPAPEGYEYDKKTGELKKKGSSIWKKIAKVGLAAAPIVAAPFTGGASLAALSVGAGAARGALDGGLKGAALGGAMGAIPGGSAAGGGKAALQAALKDPRNLARIAAPALPAQAQTAINIADLLRRIPAGPAQQPARPTPDLGNRANTFGKVRFG